MVPEDKEGDGQFGSVPCLSRIDKIQSRQRHLSSFKGRIYGYSTALKIKIFHTPAQLSIAKVSTIVIVITSSSNVLTIILP